MQGVEEGLSQPTRSSQYLLFWLMIGNEIQLTGVQQLHISPFREAHTVVVVTVDHANGESDVESFVFLYNEGQYGTMDERTTSPPFSLSTSTFL
jgi:hypothetical protein